MFSVHAGPLLCSTHFQVDTHLVCLVEFMVEFTDLVTHPEPHLSFGRFMFPDSCSLSGLSLVEEFGVIWSLQPHIKQLFAVAIN